MREQVSFVGAGRWALALALGLHRNGLRVSLYEPDEDSRTRTLETRRHPDLPESARLPEDVDISGNPGAVLAGARCVVFATPSSRLSEAALSVRPNMPQGGCAVVTVTKGIDPSSLRRLSLVLSEALPGFPVAVLAGPGIPYDFALGDPTSLVVASEDVATATWVRDSFTGSNLRIYSGNDVAGVEIGAALKNVIAIAAGIAEGLGLGINAQAALLSRGLSEMARLGIALNANPLTFSGLSGMGDLIVTSFSPNSRNHSLGVLVGRGMSMADATAQLNGVAEGAVTAESARTLAARHRIEMPITEEVCRILHESSDPRRSLRRLLGRPPREEWP